MTNTPRRPRCVSPKRTWLNTSADAAFAPRARESAPWPVLFLGHGSPMNVVGDNAAARAWARLGRALGKPRAVLCVSAHWLTRGVFLTGNARPRTIHDFGGFPEALYQIQYPAPGDPALARRTAGLLGLGAGAVTDDWGLDHGAWGVLRGMYPGADVPVVQLSLDERRSERAHWDLGRRLGPLRREGVLIVASGNIVHNLGRIVWAEDAPVPDWARDFDAAVADAVRAGRGESLADWRSLTPTAGHAHPHPTPDHFWPLLYALALREGDEPVTFPVEGFQNGSISMRAVRFG
ncbi:MAG: 4,5-DOPA dioxygenase extradiol [Elusimicrobia bacterium]|nr:4,5-DOPA dioxygenase extradiol [Elusimicrobiota bacterium]MBK7573857.1 4,5-DOPA dioxygenase extradiol [Elusimicrobiota bacterium]MBK8422698.1 4,5-DOPA dioxygenase extradiol [Elusimicrobiota bacterium]MBK9923420.1 4,5-DOPA dioxygenase extradiol [Elusimicrobiota bacterium]MBL0360325.1 4,5-DOPA dioxygenase extradiol [Elusimicrobiota bacterium]